MRPHPTPAGLAALAAVVVTLLVTLLGASPVPPVLAATEPATCPAPYDAAPLKAGWNRGLRAGGQDRSFFVLAPRSGSGPAPVLLAFNGTGETGESFAARAHLQDFADRGFLVVAPSSNANGTFWPVWDGLRARGDEGSANADLDLFDALLGCLTLHHQVDPARVYIGGHSAGGIFTNYVLQRRSDRIAGAIVASGIYSQTTPSPAVALDPTVVLVTWGGANDRWTGRAGSAAVRDFSFPSEASIASHAYAATPGVGVVTCHGADVGHAWLDPLNDWMIDVLLAHPKGGPPLTELPALPPGATATCALGPWDDAPIVGLTCPASPTPGCQAACQSVADGAWSNPTIAPVLRGELRALGFKTGDCGGCVARCEELASTPADDEVLACMLAQPAVPPGARGIGGAAPLIDAVNTCCLDRADSPWCAEVCGQMRGNLAARTYFTSCRRAR